nr:hypothetical protein [Candidatus Babeliales bacterium]
MYKYFIWIVFCLSSVKLWGYEGEGMLPRRVVSRTRGIVLEEVLKFSDGSSHTRRMIASQDQTGYKTHTSCTRENFITRQGYNDGSCVSQSSKTTPLTQSKYALNHVPHSMLVAPHVEYDLQVKMVICFMHGGGKALYYPIAFETVEEKVLKYHAAYVVYVRQLIGMGLPLKVDVSRPLSGDDLMPLAQKKEEDKILTVVRQNFDEHPRWPLYCRIEQVRSQERMALYEQVMK